MLSICIPVYNYDVRKLVYSIHKQAELLCVAYEILLFDDASTQKSDQNKELSTLSNVKYRELNSNIGRSAIRNLMATETKYPYLIFMDCDAEVCSENYLHNYLDVCQPDIVCYGGRKHPSECSSEAQRLRWTYGLKREDIPAATRQINANASFITFNFLIDKAIFNRIRFDERLKGYGHEDTLFGIELSKIGIDVVHIDNPLVHIGLETSQSFIEQTENSIKNLLYIKNNIDEGHGFMQSVKLLRIYSKLKSVHLVNPFGILFTQIKGKLLKNLLGKTPSMFYFDLYKLGYLCTIDLKKNREKYANS